jgi:urea carboxylase
MDSLDPYQVVLQVIASEGSRPEVLFRQAGDGFLQTEYGSVPRFDIVDSFRVQAINSLVRSTAPAGFIESVPGLRTNLFHFDPEICRRSELIDVIAAAERSVAHVEDIEFASRQISLPIAFEDSETRKAVGKYAKEVRPDAPNVINGYNIEYMALANGCSVEKIKAMVCGTEWYNSGNGFTPGSGMFWPLDPRCAITSPKYNPPRTWTPAGAVGIGGQCLSCYPSATGGGYQLFGRTIPLVQFALKHPVFREGPSFFLPGDRVTFTVVSEEELLHAIRQVHEAPYDYQFDIREGVLMVKDYLAFRNQLNVQKEASKLAARQAEGLAATPAV